MDVKKRNIDIPRALLDRARRYCAAAEQCETAVRQKLAAWGAAPAEADDIVAALFDSNYLDEARYARAYCESKILHQHWGRQKVLYQLRLKHLPPAAIAEGMSVVPDQDYMDILTDTAEKKLAELREREDDPVRLRQKLAAFLTTRGFTPSEVNQVITNSLNI